MLNRSQIYFYIALSCLPILLDLGKYQKKKEISVQPPNKRYDSQKWKFVFPLLKISSLIFSAWSSEREPEQLFQLLETIFQALDKLARRHQVFKVETIG